MLHYRFNAGPVVVLLMLLGICTGESHSAGSFIHTLCCHSALQVGLLLSRVQCIQNVVFIKRNEDELKVDIILGECTPASGRRGGSRMMKSHSHPACLWNVLQCCIVELAHSSLFASQVCRHRPRLHHHQVTNSTLLLKVPNCSSRIRAQP